MLDFEKMSNEELTEVFNRASNELHRKANKFLVEFGGGPLNLEGQKESLNFILIFMEKLTYQSSPIIPVRRLEMIRHEFQDWWNCYDTLMGLLPNDKPEQVSNSDDIINKHLSPEGIDKGPYLDNLEA